MHTKACNTGCLRSRLARFAFYLNELVPLIQCAAVDAIACLQSNSMLSCELCWKIKSYCLTKPLTGVKHTAALHGKLICFLTLTYPITVTLVISIDNYSRNCWQLYDTCTLCVHINRPVYYLVPFTFRVSPLKLITTSEPSVRSQPASKSMSLSGGEQTLVGVTSSGLLVNQEGKCAWPALTRGVGVKTSIKGKITKKPRWGEVECEMIKEQLKFCSVLCVWIMQRLSNLCRGTFFFKGKK